MYSESLKISLENIASDFFFMFYELFAMHINYRNSSDYIFNTTLTKMILKVLSKYLTLKTKQKSAKKSSHHRLDASTSVPS